MNTEEVQFDGTMPAGSYFICDPCYVIPDEDWDRFCMLPENTVTTFTLSSGKTIIVWFNGTEYGDGMYTAESYHGSFSVGVDSGTIGVIQVFESVKPGYSDNYIIHPKRKFEVSFEEGLFTIGPWEIQTGSDTSEEIPWPESEFFDDEDE